MPDIETERLLLRRFTPDDDADVMYERVYTDPDVMRYVQPTGWPHPREESAAFLARVNAFFDEHGFGQWAVEHKVEGRLLGYCGLKFLHKTTEVELLYGLDKDYWGQGLATEAARAALRYGFEEARLSYIVAVALPENAGSRRVLEKAGMRYEGRARHYDFEVVRYALRREEFAPGPDKYILRRARMDAAER